MVYKIGLDIVTFATLNVVLSPKHKVESEVVMLHVTGGIELVNKFVISCCDNARFQIPISSKLPFKYWSNPVKLAPK